MNRVPLTGVRSRILNSHAIIHITTGLTHDTAAHADASSAYMYFRFWSFTSFGVVR